jgi:hypothetical protein
VSPAYTVAVTREFAWRASGGLGQRQPGGECYGDKGAAQVVPAHPLVALTVQPGDVARRLHGAEHVAATVRSPA